MAEEIKETETKQEQPETPAEKTYSEADYTALQNQLNEANKTIRSFKDMDIDGIKKSADEWKQKAEALEEDFPTGEHFTVTNVKKFLYGSENVQHIEVTAV